MEKIGFIGLGNMGKNMARNLSQAGYLVTGFDIDEKLIDDLNDYNVIKANNIKSLVSTNDIIITMLPNSEIVEIVWNEIKQCCQPNSLLVDCSTIDVDTAIKIQNIKHLSKVMTLDAPVSGGVIGADNGSLTFMVGGDKNAYQRMLPLFNIMGNKSVLCGNKGSGQAAKVCNNMLLATTMIGVGEAFDLGSKLNLDLNKLFDVISTSSGSCWAVNNYCPIKGVGPESPADKDFKPGFSANLMFKDLSLAIQAINNTKAKAPFGTLAQKQFEKMCKEGNGDLDFSAIIHKPC